MKTAIDFAALAADARTSVPSFDRVLPDPSLQRDERDLLEYVRVYANEVARAAVGASLLLATIITMASLGLAGHLAHTGTPGDNDGWRFVDAALAAWSRVFHGAGFTSTIASVGVVGACIAHQWATARFARVVATGSAISKADALLRRGESLRTALWTSGVAVGAAYVTMVWIFHVGPRPDEAYFNWTQRQISNSCTRDFCVLVPIAVVVSAWLARHRPTWVRGRYVSPVAFGTALLAVAVAYNADASAFGYYTILPIQQITTFALAFAMLIWTSASVHRREQPARSRGERGIE